MTVSAPGPLYAEYVADGSATSRSIGFALRQPSDLLVAANGVPQVLGQHYAVTGVSPNQRIVPLAPFWPSGTKIAYWRFTARAQQYDVPPGEPIRNESLEDELDRNQLQQQEQDAEIARAIRVAAGETAPTLPSSISRAGKIFAFDLVGNPTFDIAAEALRNLAGGLVITAASSGSIFASLGLLLAVSAPVNNQAAIVAEDDVLGVWKYTAGNFTAQVASDPDQGIYAAPASDPTGANGMWYRVVPFRGEYMADWWLKGNYSLVQDRINRALKLMPAGATLRLPPATMTVQRAAAGSVQPGSATTINGGIVGAIYLDKDGQKLVGCGDATVLDGVGAALNIIMVRASGCEVRSLKAMRAAGQLINNEAAGVTFQPKLPLTIGGASTDLNGLLVEDCWFDDLDTGAGATSEGEIGVSPERMWIVSGLRINRCRLTNIRRQGGEFFNCDNSSITYCTFTGADRGSYTFSRFVRVIGSRGRVMVAFNKATGFDPTYSGYFGVSVETSGFYGRPAFYRICENVLIFGNTFQNFGSTLELIDSQGAVQFHDNTVECPQQSTATTTGIRISSAGIRTPGYGSQTLTGSITRTDGHGLSTGDAIWSMQNFNGFTYGTTYYAIVLDANRFQWATSPSNAAAGTFKVFTDTLQMIWLRETEVLGLPNKNVIENLSVKGNTFKGLARMVAAQGRVVLLTISGDNEWVANRSNAAVGIDLTMIGTHPFETIVEGKIENNRLVGNNISNAAPINVDGLKAGSSITCDNNKLTASANGATINHSGGGELRTRDRFSNRIIPGSVWLDNFNPPPSNIFVGA